MVCIRGRFVLTLALALRLCLCLVLDGNGNRRCRNGRRRRGCGLEDGDGVVRGFGGCVCGVVLNSPYFFSIEFMYLGKGGERGERGYL